MNAQAYLSRATESSAQNSNKQRILVTAPKDSQAILDFVCPRGSWHLHMKTVSYSALRGSQKTLEIPIADVNGGETPCSN
jgi:hypothetical protein